MTYKTEAQVEKPLCQFGHRENGIDAGIATTGEQKQRSNTFRSAAVCVMFCFKGDVSDGSSTEGETETEEKI